MVLVGERWEQTGDVAAQLRSAGTAGLGEKPKQASQASNANSMDDLPTLSGGLGQAGAFERRKMERQC